MRQLSNIDAMPLGQYFKEQVSNLDSRVGAPNQLYFHYFFDPSELDTHLGFFKRNEFTLNSQNDDLILLERTMDYEIDKGVSRREIEFCIIFKKLGLIFYNEFDEKHNRRLDSILVGIQEYFEGENTEEGWLC